MTKTFKGNLRVISICKIQSINRQLNNRRSFGRQNHFIDNQMVDDYLTYELVSTNVLRNNKITHNILFEMPFSTAYSTQGLIQNHRFLN